MTTATMTTATTAPPRELRPRLELAPDPRRIVLERVGYPSAMVRDPRLAARLLELEQTAQPLRRQLVDLAIADREDELADEPGMVPLVELRLDDELLNGLYLIRELLP